MADSARHFHTYDFKYRIGIQLLPKESKRISDGVQLWAASASYGYDDFLHLLLRINGDNQDACKK